MIDPQGPRIASTRTGGGGFVPDRPPPIETLAEAAGGSTNCSPITDEKIELAALHGSACPSGSWPPRPAGSP